MRLLSKLFGGEAKINDYFADAVWVYMRTGDPVTRLAALTAAKVATGKQRMAMVNYLRSAATDVGKLTGGDDIAYKLNQIANEITLRYWSIGDSIHAKHALWRLDKKYGKALDRLDPGVFHRRFPELFRNSRRSAPLQKRAAEAIRDLRIELMKSRPQR